VLYEMATGRRAFEGRSQASLITSIMGSQPAPLSQLAPLSPPGLERLVQACLAKDPADRLQSAHDIRIQLAWLAEGGSQAGVPTPVATRRRSQARLTVMLAAAGWLIAIAAVAWIVLKSPGSVTRPTRFTIPQPDGFDMSVDGSTVKLSPDGRSLAFVARDSTGGSQIWLRPLESTVAKPISGTRTQGVGASGYSYFLWSPDSRKIAFAGDGKLKTIAVTGGDPEVVCAVKAWRGGTWNRDGVMLIAPESNGPIYRVPAAGGEPKPVTTLDSTRAETGHRFPQFLPDGRHFLFSALPARDGKYDIYVGSLDSPERRLLMSAGTGVTWAPPGYLLYARDGKLIAQGFDAKALELRGDPVPLGDAVTGTMGSGGPIASASETGSVAYGTYQPTHQRLAWVDLSGREIAQIPVEPGPYSNPSLSPDDRRAVLVRTESADASGLWIADLERGVVTRFTDEPGQIGGVLWSPDGTRIAYMWDDNSPQVLKVKSLADNSVETFLDSDPLFKFIQGWTPDGRGIIYTRLDPQTQWDLWVLPLDGDRTPRAYLNTRFSETAASVSWDGRWMSYLSDESGRVEAYVQSFPVPGGKYQVTTGGARWVGWSPDGRHLGYEKPSDPNHVFVAEILPGSDFRLGPPRVFQTIAKDARGSVADHAWKRELTLLPSGKDPTPSITVVLDALPGRPGRRASR